MKPITMYQANDDSIWKTEGQALERDRIIRLCEDLIVQLRMRQRPERDSDYANGAGYIQQPAGTRTKLYAALKTMGWNRDTDGPVGKLYYRTICLDDQDREWGQPYYAAHDDHSKKEIAL